MVLNLTPTDIRHQLLDLRLTEAEIARRAGVHRQQVNATIQGRAKTPWLRRFIATQLGMTYLRVWGEEDPGTPRPPRAGQRDGQTNGTLQVKHASASSAVQVGGAP